MNVFEWNIERPLSYVLTGKFEAPSSNWMHEDFPLVDYELFVVTDGDLYLMYQGEEYIVGNGEYLILPPGEHPNNHRKGFRPSQCSFYWMHFSGRFEVCCHPVPSPKYQAYPYALTANTIAIPMQGKIPNPEKVIVLMRQLQDAVKTGYSAMVLNYMSTSILCELYSQFYTDSSLQVTTKRTQSQMYHDIIDYVKLNTHQNLKVADVAKHFGYNEKYLSHLFRCIAGTPLKQFILTNKMDVANFMLTDTNKSILDIALSLGFSDSHNFCKAYKKICGLTPSEYRNAFSKRLLYHQ